MAKTKQGTRRKAPPAKRIRGRGTRGKPPGRKSKLEIDPGIEKALAKQIRLGVPIKYACANVGLDESTYQRWIARADTGVSEDTGEALKPADLARYRKFREEMTRARGKKVERLLKRLHTAAKTPSLITGQYDTKPTTWLLERGEPEMFRPPAQRAELTGKDGGPIAVGSWADLVAETHEEQARGDAPSSPATEPEGEPGP